MVDKCCGGSEDERCSCEQSGVAAEATSNCGCGSGVPIEDGGVSIEGDEPKQFGPPPALSGPEWEEWADRVLDETEHNTQLGKELARDALRIADDEMTKAEFHERHQDAVVEEFGIDERPTKSELRPDEPVPHVPNDREQSRRTVLKALGAGASAAATAGLAGCLSDAGSTSDGAETGESGQVAAQETASETQMGMVIDTDRCIACLQCSQACKEENNTSAGVHWTYVFRWADDPDAEWDDELDNSMTRPCQHCSRPSCTFVCPTQARFKRDKDGIVLTDFDVCIGCRYCEVACPYGVNYFQWSTPTEESYQQVEDDPDPYSPDKFQWTTPDDGSDGFDHPRENEDGRTVAGNPPKGVMGKCTYCIHRQDSGDPDLEGTTACEDICPVDAIHFGDMNDPDDDPQQHLEAKEGSHTFQLLEEVGNDPNVIYIGSEPKSRATSVRGPISYEEKGMTEHRREVIDERWAGGDDDE